MNGGMNDDTSNTVLSGFRQMLDGVTLCRENELTLPMLTLIYTSIDALGWLASDSETASAATFTAWVDTFLHPETTLGCTAIELYAARCGLLHTGTAQSRLSRSTQVREIVYAAEGGVADLQALVDLLGKSRCVALDSGAIYHAYIGAVHTFSKEVQDRPDAYPQFPTKNLKTFMARRVPPADPTKEKARV